MWGISIPSMQLWGWIWGLQSLVTTIAWEQEANAQLAETVSVHTAHPVLKYRAAAMPYSWSCTVLDPNP